MEELFLAGPVFKADFVAARLEGDLAGGNPDTVSEKIHFGRSCVRASNPSLDAKGLIFSHGLRPAHIVNEHFRAVRQSHRDHMDSYPAGLQGSQSRCAASIHAIGKQDDRSDPARPKACRCERERSVDSRSAGLEGLGIRLFQIVQSRKQLALIRKGNPRLVGRSEIGFAGKVLGGGQSSISHTGAAVH